MTEIPYEWIEMMLYGVVVGLLAGGIAGTLAGLAGVGGGLIYVPIFYITMPGDHQNLSLHIMASLTAVALTGFFSARAHWRLGHLNRDAFRRLIPGLMIGAAVGLWSTLRVSEAAILFTLAALDAWIAWDYGRHQSVRKDIPLAIISGPIGYVSGMLGVGGGTMLVPLLRRSLSLRQAIGTSAACGMVMALTAVAINILLEPTWTGLLSGAQYFLIGTLLGIGLIIPKTSGWAAQLHSVLPEVAMRRMLKGVFIVLSATLFVASVVSFAAPA